MPALFSTFTFLAIASVCWARPAVPATPAADTVLVPVDLQQLEPYEFGFKIEDGLGMSQYRREVSDSTGAVKGSYGYTDPFGVRRIVEYTADKDGYKAIIRSNEPGIISQNSANTEYFVQPPPAGVVAEGLKNAVV